jgi:hypothetical protein
MLPEFLRFLPSPFAAIDFATELDNFKFNLLTEIQSGVVDLFL